MSRLQQVAAETVTRLNSYDFEQAAHVLYQFIWHEFCDWYLELIKPQLYDTQNPSARRHAQGILLKVLSAILRLLHPFIPFITEEIWQKLPGADGSIMVAPYPQPDPTLVNPAAEAEMRLVMDTITAVRNLRGEMNVPPASQVEVFLYSKDAQPLQILRRHQQAVTLLAKVREPHYNDYSGPPAASAKAVVDAVEIFLPLTGVIDFAEEERRLARELEKIGKELAQAQRKLANEDFLRKAPAEVVEKEQERVQTWSEKLNKLQNHQQRIRELMG